MKQWRHLRVGPVLVTVFSLAGCVDAPVLRLESPDLALEYRCSEPAARAGSEAARRVVRQYAGRIVRHESEARRPERLRSIQEAFDRNDDRLLEQAVVGYGCTYGIAAERAPRFPETGSMARDFTLPVLGEGPDGKATVGPDSVRLASLRGKVVILNFWASWCAPCADDHAALNAFVRQNKDPRVAVYGIQHRDRPDAGLRWLNESGGILFPNLVDAETKVGRMYQVQGIPRSYVLYPDGRIARSTWGFLRPEKIAATVEAVLAGS